jgi:hypothetical protein
VIAWPVLVIGEPNPQGGNGLSGEWGGTILASFAVAADMRAGTEVDVVAGQADQFGDSQPGLAGQ